MSRGEKMAGIVLGVALFFGLFYFIYTTWRAAPAGLGAGTEDMSASLDFGEEDEDMGDMGDMEEMEAEEPAAPDKAATAAPPAPEKAGQ